MPSTRGGVQQEEHWPCLAAATKPCPARNAPNLAQYRRKRVRREEPLELELGVACCLALKPYAGLLGNFRC